MLPHRPAGPVRQAPGCPRGRVRPAAWGRRIPAPAPRAEDLSSGRRGGQRSGTNRQKGRTREQLYNEAKKLGIEGRSSMNKDQLQRAVAGKKR